MHEYLRKNCYVSTSESSLKTYKIRVLDQFDLTTLALVLTAPTLVLTIPTLVHARLRQIESSEYACQNEEQ
ncbi:hypothetical protein BJ508DRAFT_328965 [Ascobolus immersus RN42]|uniref:Uncharacterized protein n=1 Tax=Ascobolus immersus RN42 TaxID=1160509 RepID=A0A3N4HY72_ASCIM|nr:hypothetical protein BJ508DRAFT_328965 [Ascobolus immersus RN42]